MFSNSSVTQGRKFASRNSILTYMQVMAKEDRKTIKSSIIDDYTNLQEFIFNLSQANESDITYNDMRDEKMLYLLTQHSL